MQVRYHRLDVIVKAKRAGNIVGGPDRQDRHRNLAVAQGTRDPCHRAVAAGDDHEIPLLVEHVLIVFALAD